MANFAASVQNVDELLVKAKFVAKGNIMQEANIDLAWMRGYGSIARRARDDREFGLTRYPYEQGPTVGAFAGGFFEHREWPIRRGLEKHNSLRPVLEYEANSINAAGYWMSFHEAAISLRHEALQEKMDSDAEYFDAWALVSIQSRLRVVGLRTEF